MRKLVLGLFLASAALGFLVSPAMAADPLKTAPAPSAADRAFIASLAAPVRTPAPVLAAKRPIAGPPTKALCSASASCESGSVSCEGNNSAVSCTGVDRNCNVGERGHVTCDGVTTWCPTECPGCPPDWCTGEEDCANNCYPCDFTYTCNETQCTDHCHCKFSTCFQ